MSLATTARVSARPVGSPTKELALLPSRERDRGRLPAAVLLGIESGGSRIAARYCVGDVRGERRDRQVLVRSLR
jgi:hypothetical protein